MTVAQQILWNEIAFELRHLAARRALRRAQLRIEIGYVMLGGDLQHLRSSR